MSVAGTNLHKMDRSTYGNMDTRQFKFYGQNGLVSTYGNVEGEILETGTKNCLWLLCVS